MLHFKDENAKRAVTELGLTIDDFNHCIAHPELSVCKQRLEELKSRAKKAFKACALKLHPDVTGGDKEKALLFSEVTKVWRVIEQMNIAARRPVAPVVTVSVSYSSGSVTNTSTSWGGWTTWKSNTST